MESMNTRSAWLVTVVCAMWALAAGNGHAQAAPEGLILYSNDATSLDDGIPVQVTTFNRSLDARLQLTGEQQARMVEIWREERAALAEMLIPADSSTERQRRAFAKGVALDDRRLDIMQQSLDRMLARLADVLSSEQLQRFAEAEQQKLGVQGRLLRMKR